METALDERLALVEVLVSKAVVVLCYRLLCPEADGDLCLLVRICKYYEFCLLKRGNPLSPPPPFPLPCLCYFVLSTLKFESDLVHSIVSAVLTLCLNIKY